MRIGFDAKRAFCNNRGLGNYSRNTIRLLSSLFPENEYVLFTPKLNKTLFNPSAENIETIVPTGFFDKKFSSYWRTKTICKEIKKSGIEIYHGLSQELPFGIEKTGAKTVVTVHDAIFMRYPKLYDPFYRKIFIYKNKHACRVADRIAANSEQTKRDMIEFFSADEKKIEVVYHGCSNIFRQNVSSETIEEVRKQYHLPQQFLLTVGAIEQRKNQSIIIDALYKGKLDIPLIIIGKPVDSQKTLEKKIADYSLKKQVFIFNNIPTKDLPAIYHAASCMIYPSIFEGFGLPVLEALCSGTPVITSQGSCFEETGGDAALYIHPNDAEEIANTIQKVLSDTQLRDKMIAKGLVHAEKFSDENIIGALMNVYKPLLENKP